MPPIGTILGEGVLDQPPPSPALGQGTNPGPPLGDLVRPQIESGAMPESVLSGIMEEGEQMTSRLDAFAQITPDLAPELAAAREALMVYLSRVLVAGAGPTSPNAVGSQFPGGGFDTTAVPLAPGG